MSERLPFFAMPCTVLHEQLSNDVLAFLTRLKALLRERWCLRQCDEKSAGTVLLGITDLMKVAGKRTPAAARALAELAATSSRASSELGPISVEARGDLTACSWPKYAILLRSETRKRSMELAMEGEGGGSESSSSSSSVLPTQKKTPPPPPADFAALLAAWRAACTAAAEHGRRWNRNALGPGRAKLIERTLRGYPKRPTVLADAIHGFAALSDDWTDEIRERCWNPEYIWRSTKIELHLDAAPARGAPPPPEEPPQAPPSPVHQLEIHRSAAAARAMGAFGTVGGPNRNDLRRPGTGPTFDDPPPGRAA